MTLRHHRRRDRRFGPWNLGSMERNAMNYDSGLPFVIVDSFRCSAFISRNVGNGKSERPAPQTSFLDLGLVVPTPMIRPGYPCFSDQGTGVVLEGLRPPTPFLDSALDDQCLKVLFSVRGGLCTPAAVSPPLTTSVLKGNSRSVRGSAPQPPLLGP